jgi:hypothetical protein
VSLHIFLRVKNELSRVDARKAPGAPGAPGRL